MRANAIVEFTGPTGLRTMDLPEPKPGRGEVAIDVQYAGINYVEALFSRGLVDVALPWVPGIEAAGIVRATGPGVTAVSVGDRVAALTITSGGGYAQIVVADADLTASVPAGLGLALAAAVPSNTTTALIAAERVGQVAAGSEVLVHAAVGGLGSQIGQVARLCGAHRVVGIVGTSEKAAAAHRLGYDEVWLRTELGEQAPGQFDVIFDPVGGAARLQSLRLLRLGGRIVALGNASQAPTAPVDTNALWLQGTGIIGFNLAALASSSPHLVGEYLRRSLEHVANGSIVVPLTDEVPFEHAGAALGRLEAGATSGKAVLSLEATAQV